MCALPTSARRLSTGYEFQSEDWSTANADTATRTDPILTTVGKLDSRNREPTIVRMIDEFVRNQRKMQASC